MKPPTVNENQEPPADKEEEPPADDEEETPADEEGLEVEGERSTKRRRIIKDPNSECWWRMTDEVSHDLSTRIARHL